MKRRTATRQTDRAAFYDRHGVLGEVIEQPVPFALDEELRAQILSGKRGRRLQNLSIKLDPAQIQALRRIATMKAIPYQTLIRQWFGRRDPAGAATNG